MVMTNGDKFIKDGSSIEEFKMNFCRYLSINGYDTSTVGNVCFALERFLEQSIKPTLTEDERVILRNIKGNPKYIARQKGYGLMAYDKAKREGKTGWSYDNGRELHSFSHLFQFIKERRRIRNSRTIERGIK
jgi:hypothetical protein